MRSLALVLGALLLAACRRDSGSGAASAPEREAESVPRTVDRGDGCSVEITRDGEGPAASVGSEVTLVYEMRIKDTETPLASTDGWDTPCRIRLGEQGVVPGLARGLEGLRAGSKARIEVPPALGYGEQGVPSARIPADSTLVFDVQILGVR